MIKLFLPNTRVPEWMCVRSPLEEGKLYKEAKVTFKDIVMVHNWKNRYHITGLLGLGPNISISRGENCRVELISPDKEKGVWFYKVDRTVRIILIVIGMITILN